MSFPGESIVTVFVENLLQELKEKKKILDGVKGGVKLLVGDLGMINAFLQDSEGQRDANVEATKLEVINQMREVSVQIEHVIDRHTYHVLMQKRRNVLAKPVRHVIDLGDIADTIAEVKTKIETIHNNRGRYVTGRDQQAEERYARASPSLVLERRNTRVERDDAVGLEDPADTWVEQLINPNKSRRDVVSIVGMGGLGKSKLGRKIYDKIVARVGCFECWAWVYGSPEFKRQNWLVEILRSLLPVAETAEDYNEIDEWKLKDTLLRRLTGKRYLVVLDGMWNTGVWETIESAFPDDGNGSRILITCREGIPTSSPFHQYYSLPFLNKDSSWTLFHNKVLFEETDDVQYANYDLENIGKELAANCKGLPLSIIVLGELLLSVRLIGAQHSLLTWESYKRHVNSHLIRTKTRCFDVLAESYKHLTPQLKSCFLYLSLFPEDFVISASQLTQLWSAEGLIMDYDSRDVLDIAEECLTKLVNKSLIQVESKRIGGANVKTFHIHSILRELSRFEGEREKFIEPRLDDKRASSVCRGRKLSVQGDISLCLRYDSPSASSSLLLFSESTRPFEEELWKRIFQSFIYVRVLYLWKVLIKSIPDEIENLIFLKSITICGDKKSLEIEAIPDSICKLGDLETINIDGHVKACLPKRIWNMTKLRHLRVSKGMWLPKPQIRLKDYTLTNLRVLSGVVIDVRTADLMSLSIFPNVKKLHLVFVPNKQNNQVDAAKRQVDKAQQKLKEAHEKLVEAQNAQKQVTKAEKKVNGAEEKVRKAEEKARAAQENQEAQEFQMRTQVLKSLETLRHLKSLKIDGFGEFEAISYVFPLELNKVTFVSSYLDLHYLIKILGNLSKLRILKIRKPYGPNVDQLRGAHRLLPHLDITF